jgi:two-component system, NtrC family, sensor kinase
MDEAIKILCVDDEKNVLRALQRVFLDEDYELFTAVSGSEGLEILDKEPGIRVVISDYRMPEMNGVDFLREVHRRRPDTVRIVLSGYADTAAVVDAINEGQIFKFIPKPWNDDELRMNIANALEMYSLHARNQQLMAELQSSNEELRSMNDNLENLVAQRTAELTFRNRVLVSAQNILHSLPQAVVGIDRSDQVVYCNEKAYQFLGKFNRDLVGNSRFAALPAEINTFIDQYFDQARPGTVGRMQVLGVGVLARAVQMSYDKQQGLIVTLGWGEDNV